jgi:hypothetical protein
MKAGNEVCLFQSGFCQKIHSPLKQRAAGGVPAARNGLCFITGLKTPPQ